VLTRPRQGFTLIELLVVIAIIGILASMLFPVYSRARQSARKTQCLANVKNIVTAILMYESDYERLWNTECDRTVIGYFNTAPGGDHDPYGGRQQCPYINNANPYLREAVVLEEYVKNREVWRCPSARLMNGAQFIVPMGKDGYWLNSYTFPSGTQFGKAVGKRWGPCYPAFPPGWGGDIHDTFSQRLLANVEGFGEPAGHGVFIQGIGVNARLADLSLSWISDASSFVACGDTGKRVQLKMADFLAYPDYCQFNFCGGTAEWTGCPQHCAADWENCPQSRDCGMNADMLKKALFDPGYRKQLTRHMGGSNVGFLDGHVKWFLADAIMTQSHPFKHPYFEGICSCWPGNWKMK
jgi:prepilin-type N-terminal cleavage/methylation domain-containing protein/prepilin-type processing-associated H-X9-DG protein